METELMTKGDIAAMFHVHDKTVETWVRRRVIPQPIKLGGLRGARAYWPRSEIVALVERLLREREE
jgi:predicted DNA-binding transcriptional regulator AlpA